MDNSLPALCLRETGKALWRALCTLLQLNHSTSPREARVKLRLFFAFVLVAGPPAILLVADWYSTPSDKAMDLSNASREWRFVFAYWSVVATAYLVVFLYWLVTGLKRLNRRIQLQARLADGVHLRAQMIRALRMSPKDGEAMHMAHLNKAVQWIRDFESLAGKDPTVRSANATLIEVALPIETHWAWQRADVPLMEDRCAKLAAVIHDLAVDAPQPKGQGSSLA
jgi:hypothetical protein